MMFKLPIWLFLIFALSIFGITGCQRAASDIEERVVYEYTSPESRATLTVILPTLSLGIADRLNVRVLVESPPLFAVRVDDIDWEDGGWTLIDAIHHPLKEGDRTQGEIVTFESEYVLEPFLPGEYVIPSIHVHLTMKSEVGSVLQSDPIAVTVDSSLEPEDIGELAPAAESFIPPPESQPKPSQAWLIVTGAFVIIIIAYLVWRSIRRGRAISSHEQSPKDLLQGVVDSTDLHREDAFAQLARALSLLFPRIQETSEIRGMIEECEQARFSLDHQASVDPSSLAKHALELLGEYEETIK
jgi:hypothetical protein